MIRENWPTGWQSSPLKALLREPLRNGKSAKASESGRGIRTLTLSAVTQGVFSEDFTKLTVATEAEAAGLWLEPGDILIERSNTPELVGTAALFRGPRNWAIFPDLLIRVRLNNDVLPAFVDAWLRTTAVRRYFQGSAQGIAGSMPKISQPTVENVVVPIPPLDEQRQIVAAIETQFTRLDSAVATLERVRANLKRARASVLKAAVEGRLVPTEAEVARAEGRPYEPASVLLERILEERKARWPKGKKYAAPVAPEAGGLPGLPEGWVWATAGQCADSQVGHAFKSADFREQGVNLLRGDNIGHGRLRWDDKKRRCIGEHALLEFPDLQMAANDIVLAMDRPVISTGLKIAEVKAEDLPALLVQRVVRLRAVIQDRYFLLNLLSPAFIRHLQTEAKGGGVPHISEGQIKEFSIPVPPAAEQVRIVAEVERRLSLLDKLDATVDLNLARCTRLRQSILKRAFEGRLVPQDPHDEPAAVLLDRIQSQVSRAV